MDCAYDFLLNELGLKVGDSVVVACSGGPDSMALLSLIIDIRRVIDISIICAHVNHNVRNESDSEQAFVYDFCCCNDVIFDCMIIDEYDGDNFECEARNKRYNYFDEVLKRYGAEYLFTAHHGDDLMETILMRIARGSSLKGYSGFSCVTDREFYKIVRPLIHVTKDDILCYNKKNNIPFVVDQTNFLDVHTRNRFRKVVLPFLKEEDGMVHDKFYKFSQVLLECDNYINNQVSKVIDSVYLGGVLLIDGFLRLDYVLAERIIYKILEDFYKDNFVVVSDRHVKLIYDLINSSRSNCFLCLPGDVRAFKSYNKFWLESFKYVDNSYYMEIVNCVFLPNGRSIRFVDNTCLTSNNVIRLCSDDITLPLFVRTRKNGDRMFLKGCDGSKKIKDIFIDCKVSMSIRDGWPIVVDSAGVIIWVPGLKKSKFDRQKDEKYDIILEYC